MEVLGDLILTCLQIIIERFLYLKAEFLAPDLMGSSWSNAWAISESLNPSPFERHNGAFAKISITTMALRLLSEFKS